MNPQPDVLPDAAVTNLTFVLSFGTSAFGERYDASLQQLTSLSIQATGEFDVAPLSPLVVAASGGHLRSFSYEGETLEPDIVDASGWEELNLDKLSMSDVFFTSFPAFTSFTLIWTCRMTVVKISLLADTSPTLQSLNLTGTMWDCEPEHFVASGGSASVVEAQLIDVLRRLSSLRKVNFGLFRVYEKQPFARLDEYCSSRTPKLEMAWEGMARN